MSFPRFFCTAALVPEQRIALPDDLAHHAVRVLRLRTGDPVVLFDGTGGNFPAVLEIEDRKAWAAVGARVDDECELPQRVVLVQGIAGGDKMDWIVEKAVEMGVTELVPVTAQRSVIQLSAERREKRLKHWQRIAVAASEQCGRNRLMQVLEPQSLAQWLGRPEPDLLRLVCHPAASKSLATAVGPHDGPFALLVGPEGGWSDDELALMAEYGLTRIRFGQRVLRTETAGIALMAAVAAIKGWNELPYSVADPE